MKRIFYYTKNTKKKRSRLNLEKEQTTREQDSVTFLFTFCLTVANKNLYENFEKKKFFLQK